MEFWSNKSDFRNYFPLPTFNLGLGFRGFAWRHILEEMI
ncbi:hypothetical protein LEP1GSC125_2345 [Leptospira mayottensis 200901122]|uniref:Uncharacterized protein n=1 Tax=Leptospira mayottensis 200901122 TaxID=1193010 RepID=A0AA87MN46_9LEPT|nr:hypothetical protein LEP1GSC125_2345 [Leptospira mayottensis 200901122]